MEKERFKKLLQEAKDECEKLKAEGWTQQDFALALAYLIWRLDKDGKM